MIGKLGFIFSASKSEKDLPNGTVPSQNYLATLGFFYPQEMVRRTPLQVNAEKSQFSVSLKQSVTGNHTAAYLASLLQSLELAATMK